MQRFFLHVRIDGALCEDLDGQLFPSLEAARTEAVLAAREIMSDWIRCGTPLCDGRIEIVDDAGRLLLSLSFAEAISLPVG